MDAGSPDTDDGDDPGFPEADGPPDDDEGKLTAAETNYNNTGNGVKKVVAMAIGLNNDTGDAPLVDVTTSPWNSFAKKEVKLSILDLRGEILRRVPGDSSPKCGYWTVKRCYQWLTSNPVTEVDDVLFIRRAVQTTIDDCKVMVEEGLVPATPAEATRGQWRGNIPYLRLIMCLVEDDEIRSAYLHRGDPLSRTQLDARNSVEVREATVFELLANKWNDNTYNPFAPVSDVHEDFQQPTDCSFEKVEHLAIAQPLKIKNYLSNMRAALARTISAWELSGQGDGSLTGTVLAVDDSDADEEPVGVATSATSPITKLGFGQLDKRSHAAMDCRGNFLLGMPTYLLMFWELADKHQLLQSTLQRLDRAACPGAPEIPPVSRASPTGSDSAFGSNAGFEATLGAFNVQFSTQTERRETITRHSELIDQLRNIREKMMLALPENKAFYQGEIDKIEKEIEENSSERRRLERELKTM